MAILMVNVIGSKVFPLVRSILPGQNRGPQNRDALYLRTKPKKASLHYRKAIMCDAPLEDESGRKRVVAFVGGLDITNGRYDDPTFPLWSTIKTVHSTDFYNNCVPGATQGGNSIALQSFGQIFRKFSATPFDAGWQYNSCSSLQLHMYHFQFEQIFGRFLILLNRHPGDRSEGAVARLPRQGRGAHRRRPREQLCRQNQEAGAGESALHVRHR